MSASVHVDDLRFVYDSPPTWRTGQKQILHGTEFTTMENNNNFTNNPRKLEWDIDTKRPIICDLQTRFEVTGEFQVKAVNGAWAPLAAGASADVMVVPNWWSILIKNIELFHLNYHAKQNDEPQNVGSHLEQFLLWAMDPVLKKHLCYEDCHPGNAVPDKKGDWIYGTEAASSWQRYSKFIFTGSPINFHWTPLFFFPLYQGSNHVYDDKGPPRCVPIPYVGKLQLRITLKDSFSDIFKKRQNTDTNQYRFLLNKVDLICEEARMNPVMEKKLFQSSNKTLAFNGITKLAHAETIPAATFNFQTRFENVPMPEGLLIFALPKTVQGDAYKFETHTLASGFYLQHNIESVQLNYGGMNFTMKEPNFGSVDDDYMEMKNMMDYAKCGPFGLFFAQNRLTQANLHNGFAGTDFPHVYLNLCPSGQNSRLIPLLDSGSVLQNNHDFNVSLKFKDPGATADSIYVIYLIYTGTNMLLDLKEKRFVNPIIR